MNDMLRELADGSRDLAGKLSAQIMITPEGASRRALRSVQKRLIALAEEAESWIS